VVELLLLGVWGVLQLLLHMREPTHASMQAHARLASPTCHPM
jgi:hypothetical protein